MRHRQGLLRRQGEEVAIEIVAYGPRLNTYVAESPVKNRISAMALENPEMHFSAFGNTLAAMARKAGHEVALMPEAKATPVRGRNRLP